MGWLKLLLALGIALATLAVSGSAALAIACPDDVCGALSDDGAVLDGNLSGGDQHGPSAEHGTGPNTNTAPDPYSGPPGTYYGVPCDRLPGTDEICDEQLRNLPVVISDVAHFRPTPPGQRMEPDGWAVVGVPANFIALADAQTLRGEILDVPAEVRFTPVAYSWDYGDGRSARRAIAGDTWRALGLAEFASTPTGHIYGEPGRYAVRLTVAYSVEFRLHGIEWRSIDGLLELRASDIPVTVVSAQTVLVEDDCRRNPSGPGC